MKFIEDYDTKDRRVPTSEPSEFYSTVWSVKLLTLAQVVKPRKKRKKRDNRRRFR